MIRTLALQIALVTLFIASGRVTAQADSRTASTSTENLSLEQSIQYTLEHNPQLLALREQHGIAAGAVVIAKTYPFNPIYQSTVLYSKNTDQLGSRNKILNSHQLTLELQLMNQQEYRREAAFAALTRTDFEIASQELLFAVATVKAFDEFLFRKEKLAISEEFLKLNAHAAVQVQQLVERGTLKPGDLILSRAEVNDLEAQVSLARTTLVSARRGFYRALGISDGDFDPEGTMDRPAPTGGTEHWLELATALRPDLLARETGVKEAEAIVRLQRADRFGNPQIGPVYERNESGTEFIGAKIQFSLPVLNRKAGEIAQAEVKRDQASRYVRQSQIEIEQDVRLNAQKVVEAANWVANYRKTIIPALERSLRDMTLLFEQGQAGVDILRLLDIRRKLLRAREGRLDALLAYTQTLSDLALAIGDPGFALGTYANSERASVARRVS